MLGVTVGGRDITLISGWNWYAGADAIVVGANQYDFQTAVTHELGHALGLGHSADTGSVMYPTLAPGAIRRDFTADDLTVIEQEVESQPEPLRAAPTSTTGHSKTNGHKGFVLGTIDPTTGLLNFAGGGSHVLPVTQSSSAADSDQGIRWAGQEDRLAPQRFALANGLTNPQTEYPADNSIWRKRKK